MLRLHGGDMPTSIPPRMPNSPLMPTTSPPNPTLALALAIAVTVAACLPAPSPPTQPPASRATASLRPVRTISPFGTPEVTQGGQTPVDRALLDILPSTVAGLTVEPSPEGDVGSASDPGLAEIAASFATAVAVDPQTGDFVFAAVVAVKPGILTEQVFRDWRDSFDEGACSQAGGVVGNAQAELGGRTVYIGSCDGGLLTYHTWIEDRGILVSASSVGAGRLGEKLMEGLR